MLTILIGSIALLVVPSYLVIMVFHSGIYVAWVVASAYITALGVIFFVRFRGGKWKAMKVIEEPVVPL